MATGGIFTLMNNSGKADHWINDGVMTTQLPLNERIRRISVHNTLSHINGEMESFEVYPDNYQVNLEMRNCDDEQIGHYLEEDTEDMYVNVNRSVHRGIPKDEQYYWYQTHTAPKNVQMNTYPENSIAKGNYRPTNIGYDRKKVLKMYIEKNEQLTSGKPWVPSMAEYRYKKTKPFMEKNGIYNDSSYGYNNLRPENMTVARPYYSDHGYYEIPPKNYLNALKSTPPPAPYDPSEPTTLYAYPKKESIADNNWANSYSYNTISDINVLRHRSVPPYQDVEKPFNIDNYM